MKKFLGSKKNIVLIIAVVIAMAFSTLIFSCTRKQNIHNATLSDLNSVEGIGEVLSKQIYSYIQTNNVESVDKLKNHVPNVGDKRIKELKKKYK